MVQPDHAGARRALLPRSGPMLSVENRRVLKDFADCQANETFRGSPFYKPVGKFFDLDVEQEGVLADIGGSASKSLYFGRLLLAGYENELIYIPDDPRRMSLAMWSTQYAEEKVFQSHCVRHLCERPYFHDFRSAIDVTGEWSLPSFEDYFADYVAALDCADTRAIVARIHASKSPHDAALFNAIQFTAEFLVEASGMTRNLQGYYGPEQSEYFKIIIDEYGYGVFGSKHSTLYREFLESVGLDGRHHRYWWFYLPATLLSNNYINVMCNNHGNFFRYMGSLTQSENSFAISLDMLDKMYRELFPAANTAYFKEHVHIDQHHGRMAFQDLCLSLARRLGNDVIPEIVRGFEESMDLGKRYRAEFESHLDWFDGIWPETEACNDDPCAEDADFFTTMTDRPTVLSVETGAVFVHPMPRIYRPVRAGESMLIPARTLFGIRAEKGSWYRLDLRH
jgi:hypothetical protein